MTEPLLQRAEILIQQQRYADAERILKDVLSTDPNDVRTLVLLTEVNFQLGQIDKAVTLIDTAIGISPESAYLFYIKARISIYRDKYDDAEKYIKQALELDPSDADFYALWASVKLTRKQFEEALDMSNRALELDPENILGLNTRSTALLKLNKHEESFQTIEGALREDPNNAYTHANYGWNLLEKGNQKKALEHFRESLKNDPNSSYAQSGMVEALKANNIFYRLFLKYAFWIGNLTSKYQWGVIIGFYAGSKILRSIAANNEVLQPFLNPLIILLALVAFSTWIITPVSNLFLRLSKYGKHLLSQKEIMSSNFVGISFVIFLAGLLAYFVAGDLFLPIAVFGFAMMVPFSTMFAPSKYKYSLVIYAAFMALTGIAAIWATFATGEVFNSSTTVFVFEFIAFQLAANFLIIRENNY
ncbi:tetratricopeptide repeat protein [Dyadobacter psychrotolerans]|uniref:Tetratricopeptide repeat protein n=1 Tax=Dyadobacter psychrotolerans TaxID=2541721 RepID=A0A4R5DND5_9BACT|nr:tetratricopeptide repeat protein [Dyadobacter psychrotolerans]TDE13644.1 tetratricopeptide repeat protein [Dyadobacter psychrotolerans]